MSQNLDVHKRALISLSGSPNFPEATQGDSYTVSVAGLIGGASGQYLAIGATIVCITDTAGGDYATVGANWSLSGAGVGGLVTAVRSFVAEELTGGAKYGINNATGFAMTLPAAFKGMDVYFYNVLANTSGNHTIATAAGANVLKGGTVNRAGVAGSSDDDGDLVSFVANQSIPGDFVHLVCLDGTNINVFGFADVAAGVTITKVA